MVHRRRDRGAAAVEFALVLPMLLIVVFGIIDFGRMLNAKIVLTQAAREGSRAAAVGTQVDGETWANNAAAGLGINPPVVVSCTDRSIEAASAVLTVDFEFITPLSFLIGSDGAATLRSEAVTPCMH